MRMRIALALSLIGLGAPAAQAQVDPATGMPAPSGGPPAGTATATPSPAATAPAAGAPAAPPPIEEKPVTAIAAPADTPPDQRPTQENFQRALSPYGRWVTTPEYGTVWVPNGVGPRWRPYTHGRWVYTRHGWTFVSYDPWGWAPFHYGRWVYHPAYGWSWIPGYEWAPAWVSWRYGGGYISWAPLGPLGVAAVYYDTPSLWIAVRGPYFYRPLRYHYFVPTVRIGAVFRTTYYAGVPRPGVYFSPPVRYVSSIVGRPIRRVSARRVAPLWVQGRYRPRRALRAAWRRARVVARPSRRWATRERWRRGGKAPPRRGRPWRARRGRPWRARRGRAWRGRRGRVWRGHRGWRGRGWRGRKWRGGRGRRR